MRARRRKSRQASALASVVTAATARSAAAGGFSDRRRRSTAARCGVVALREARVDAERIEHAAERGGEAARVLADVQARGVQPEGRRLDAHRSQVIGGDLARDRSRDHVEHLLDGLDRDARLVRRLVEQPGGHVHLRRRLEVGREQRQREAIGLAAVAPLEIRHVRRQGTARVEPGGERGRRRTATATHAEAPGEVVERPAMPLDGEPPVQAQRLGGHGRHHRRIAVAVAADPRGQREPPGRRHQARVVLGHRGVELEADPRQRVPEDLLDEVEPGAHLVGDGGAGGARALGEPERGDLRPQRGDLARPAPGAADRGRAGCAASRRCAGASRARSGAWPRSDAR